MGKRQFSGMISTAKQQTSSTFSLMLNEILLECVPVSRLKNTKWLLGL